MDVSTKPRTETEKLFALDKPSLENLSYCLRHPETWPESFFWDYSHCDQCAMGLAHELWSSIPESNRDDGASTMARSFAIPYEVAQSIFLGREGGHCASWTPQKMRWFRSKADLGSVTPEMVADQIDKHIASAR